jgi:hypothetical protein
MLLESSMGLHFEFIVAEKLSMTVKRLRRELGPGELSFWIAKADIDQAQYERARKDAERNAAKK